VDINDIKSTHLNRELGGETLIEAPPGFDVPEGMVSRPVRTKTADDTRQA
jgi:hypothetical protein